MLKALTQQVSMLTSKLEKLNPSPSLSSAHMIQHCEVCGSKIHGSESCSMPLPQEEVNALYGNVYNPNFKHPNLSYRSQNILNPQPMVQQQQFGPPGFQQRPQLLRPQYQQTTAPPPPQQKNSLESMFEQFMSDQMQTNMDLKNKISELKMQGKVFENQLNHLG